MFGAFVAAKDGIGSLENGGVVSGNIYAAAFLGGVVPDGTARHSKRAAFDIHCTAVLCRRIVLDNGVFER